VQALGRRVPGRELERETTSCVSSTASTSRPIGRTARSTNNQDLDSYLLRNDPTKLTGTVTFTCGTPGSAEGVSFANGFSVIEEAG